MIAFEYFLRNLAEYRATVLTPGNQTTNGALPGHETWLLAYALFFWITTFWVPPALQQSDILVFVIYLLAAALCMQLSHHPELWRFAFLGIVLALGYLIKAVMLPLGFVFLLALWMQQPRKRSFAQVLLAGLVFVALSLPFCLALSSARGRLTYGDAGVINYRHIMGMDITPLPPSSIPRPEATPHIQEYSNKLRLGTYPPWADPSYDFKGSKFVLAERLLRCQILWLPTIAGLLFLRHHARLRPADYLLTINLALLSQAPPSQGQLGHGPPTTTADAPNGGVPTGLAHSRCGDLLDQAFAFSYKVTSLKGEKIKVESSPTIGENEYPLNRELNCLGRFSTQAVRECASEAVKKLKSKKKI